MDVPENLAGSLAGKEVGKKPSDARGSFLLVQRKSPSECALKNTVEKAGKGESSCLQKMTTNMEGGTETENHHSSNN